MSNEKVVMEVAEYWTAVNVYKCVERALRFIDFERERNTDFNVLDIDEIENLLNQLQDKLNYKPIVTRALKEIAEAQAEYERIKARKAEQEEPTKQTKQRTFGRRGE